jgi:hypothetical protein
MREDLARLVVDARMRPLGENATGRPVGGDTTGAQNRDPVRAAGGRRETVQHRAHHVPGVRPFPARTQDLFLVLEIACRPSVQRPRP